MPAINRFRYARIAAGTSLAPTIYLGAGTLVGLQMPTAWDAAPITFEASADGVTWGNLFDTSGVEVSLVVAAGDYVVLDPSAFTGTMWLKVRSGTSAAPVNQTAIRQIQVFNRVQGYAG